MVRRIVGALVCMAVFAASARSQTPFTEKFTFTSGGSGCCDFDGYRGEFTSSTNIGFTGETLNSPFQIWCVDPAQGISDGTSYDVWVTPLAGTDFTHTFEYLQINNTTQTGPGSDQRLYTEAAYDDSKMTPGISTADENLEYANWTLLGYTTVVHGATACQSPWTFSTCGGYNATTVGNNVSTAAGSYGSVNLADWFIITQTSGITHQEFLYYSPSGGTTQSVTPEPTTMSLLALGLIGMTGADLRRRRRRKDVAA